MRSRRHVLVIVNPFSGQKRGLKLWESHVEPILKTANINYDIVKTGFIGSFHFCFLLFILYYLDLANFHKNSIRI